MSLINVNNLTFASRQSFPGQLHRPYFDHQQDKQDNSGLSGNLCQFAMEKGIDETLFKTMLRKLDFDRSQFEKNIEDYSSGQRKKVLIAASLCEEAHLYVWDEPLNFIDVLSRMQIEQLLTDYEPTMIFVEHDKAFCESVATRIIEI